MTHEQILEQSRRDLKAIYKKAKEKLAKLEQDKFAELKEAHTNGAVIQLKMGYRWFDCDPVWTPIFTYRIKPEEKPKVGDVVKAWNNNSSAKPIIGKLEDLHLNTHYGIGGHWYDNAKTLTQQQVQELLFGKEVVNG